MEARVQYAKTSDGVDIAFAVYGEGPPLVIPPNLANSHVQLEMVERAEMRSFYERLSQRLQVIRYDCRGLGMSQRDQVDFSTGAAMRDLAAVVDRLGLDRFALYTHTLAGDGPMAFAAEYPDRVAGLICWIGETVTILPEVARRMAVIDQLQATDWDLYCNIIARLMYGWDSPEATPFANMMKAGTSPGTREQALKAAATTFRGEWPARVQAPTLVLHNAGIDAPTRRARRLASSIPSSQVVGIPVSPGSTRLLPPAVLSTSELFSTTVADFVEATWAKHAPPPALPHQNKPSASGTAIILFTDIADSTALTERLGDTAFRTASRALDNGVREAIREAGGSPVEGKVLGDGVMGVFTSAADAISAARACVALAGELPMHIGIHAGDVIREETNVYGGAVNIASRICGICAPGEILVTDIVRGLARTSAGVGVTFEDRGEHALKGIADAVRVYAVRAQLA